MIFNPRIISGIQIAFCGVLALAYVAQKNYRMGAYWFFAGCITFTVTSWSAQ